ncbi:restriction endonuclease subunit S [Planomicrobium okeanokoites]|uniref:restriction endonuclease subunit S n=1 Tax=Planomicrobium okeanokoites TaxID=244 RepID=UPI0030F80F14
MLKVSDLFYLESGNGLALNKLSKVSNGISFVSRTSKNNGVSAFVEPLDSISPFPSGLITVALSGNSVLEACVQPFNFYTGYHVMVLTPKENMSLQEKLFYCACIRHNRYKYNFGRQANRTLADLLIPDTIPQEFEVVDDSNYNNISDSIESDTPPPLNKENWQEFKYQDLFEMATGGALLINKAKKNPGNFPLVSATRLNNAIATHTAFPPHYPGNTLIIIKNGVNVGQAFYQEQPFSITTDVAVLLPKFELNPFIAMFLISVINKESYRYSYGRKWGKGSFFQSKIKLPATPEGSPDWEFMNKYIQTLSYSKSI